jgi:hypothetical protein
MKSAFPFLAAAALLLGASTAQAARPMGHGADSNISIPATPPLQSSVPPTTNSGALDVPRPLGTPPVNAGALGITNPGAIGVPNPQSFGALPGSPGSATFDPNAALPSLDNQGSALAPQERRHRASVPQARVAECKTNEPSFAERCSRPDLWCGHLAAPPHRVLDQSFVRKVHASIIHSCHAVALSPFKLHGKV